VNRAPKPLKEALWVNCRLLFMRDYPDRGGGGSRALTVTNTYPHGHRLPYREVAVGQSNRRFVRSGHLTHYFEARLGNGKGLSRHQL